MAKVTNHPLSIALDRVKHRHLVDLSQCQGIPIVYLMKEWSLTDFRLVEFCAKCGDDTVGSVQ